MNEQMQTAIDFIEEKITEELDMIRVSQVAGYSPYHFQRLFQMLTGQTLGSYIRKRRLTLASMDILRSSDKLIDLAFKYGYESPEAFSRAFKKLYGLTPSSLRKSPVSLISYPKVTLSESYSEEVLTYRIEEKEAFLISGYKRSFTADQILDTKAYSNFWMEKKHVLTGDLIGAGAYRKDDRTIYDAIIGFIGEEDGLDQIIVEKTKWCIFTGRDLKYLDRLWKNIFLNWFPKTDFEHSGGIEIEFFPKGDKSSPDYEYEIWIPLIQSQSC